MIEIVPPINRLRLDFLLVQLLRWKAETVLLAALQRTDKRYSRRGNADKELLNKTSAVTAALCNSSEQV